jgi:PAS domain S-box-containing protein
VKTNQRSRKRLAALNGAILALSRAGSVEEASRELMREVCENLGWSLGGFWYPDPDGRALRLYSHWLEPAAQASSFLDASRATHFEPAVGLPGRVWASRSPEWIPDVLAHPDFPRAAAAREAGLHGAFAAPVPLGGDDRFGVLEFFTRHVIEPDPELLETMTAVGRHLGHFIRSRRVEADLKAREAQFFTFGSTVADATFVIDEASRIVYVNDAVRRIFGYSPSELLGAPLDRLIPERLRERHAEGMERYLETGERRVRWDGMETWGLRRDGSEVPLEITFGAFESEGRQFFTGIARDITERHRATEQLHFQARLLDAVGEAIMATDLEGKILYWNAAAERLYGWSAEEVIGRDVSEVTPAFMPREHAQEIMDRLADGEPWTGELRARDKTAREFPVLISDSPIADDDGRLIGVIGTAMDITERKRQEEGQRFMAEASRVLASSLDYPTTLRSVAALAVPHLGDWCLVHLRDARDGPLMQVARAVPDGDEAAADALARLLTGDDHLMPMVMAGEAAVTGPAENGPAVLRKEQLQAIGATSLLAVPLHARGEALGVMTFGTNRPDHRYDDTDVEFAEELGRRAGVAIDNARLYRDAEEGNRAKADFLAVVSHELRTPLNAITGYADLLSGGIAGELNEKQERHVERIKVGAGHLAHLIDEILSYARVEAGQETLTVGPTDLAKIARESAAALDPDARDRGLVLEVDVPPRGPVVRTDGGKVRQIMVNLLSNAVKYTDRGTVRLELRSAEQGAEVRITDTGIGIPPEAMGRIFEPFWQAESPNTRTVGGTGLGLSVSSRLAELIEGTIAVESEVGVGTTFTVRLPDLNPGPLS